MLGGRSCDLLLEFGYGARETHLLEQSPHLRLHTGHFLFAQFVNGLRGHVGSREAAHENGVSFASTGHRTNAVARPRLRRVLALQIVLVLTPRGKELVIVGVHGRLPKPGLFRVWEIRWESPERREQRCVAAVLTDLRRKLVGNQVHNYTRLRHAARNGFVLYFHILIDIGRHGPQAREQGFVVVNGSCRHEIDDPVNVVVKSQEQSRGHQMGLNFEGLDLRTEIILEEPDSETVLPGKACRGKPVQLLQPPLEMSAALCAPGCGTVGPAVVVVVTADSSGEFRVVPQPLFERLLEEVPKGLRPGNLDKQNQNDRGTFHGADYTGNAPTSRRTKNAAE